MDLPRLTIVTTNFNYGRFLGAAIESVLAEAYPNLEYFVFDGGSSDGSAAIIARYGDRLADWHSERDHGPAAALNLGLRRATGEWFYYLNSDDLLLPGALQTFAAAARSGGAYHWISGGRHEIDADGKLLRRRLPWRDEVHLFALNRMWHAAEGTFLHVPSLRLQGLAFDESYQSIFDTVLYTQLDRGTPPLYVDACFGAMRIHGANRSGPTHSAATAQEAARHALACGPQGPLVRLVDRLSRTRFVKSTQRTLAWAFLHGFLGRRPRRWAAVPDKSGAFSVHPLRGILRQAPPVTS